MSAPSLFPVNGYCPPDTFAVKVYFDVAPDQAIAAFNYIVFDANSGEQNFNGGNVAISEAVIVDAQTWIIYIPLSDVSIDSCGQITDYVIVRAAYVDGSLTDFSGPLDIHLPPCVPIIPPGGTTRLQDPTQAVVFMEIPLDVSYIDSFNVALQSEVEGVVQVTVQTGLSGEFLNDPSENVWYTVVTGLTEGVSYRVAAQAVHSWSQEDSDGIVKPFYTTSCLSDTVSLGDHQELSPPTDVTATADCGGAVVVTWVPPIDRQFLVYTGYKLYYQQDVSGAAWQTIDLPFLNSNLQPLTNFAIGGLLEGATYNIYMTSISDPEGLESGPSNTSTVLVFQAANSVEGAQTGNGLGYVSVTFYNPIPTAGQTPADPAFSVQLYQYNGNVPIGEPQTEVFREDAVYSDPSAVPYYLEFDGGSYAINPEQLYYFTILYSATTTIPGCENVTANYVTSNVSPLCNAANPVNNIAIASGLGSLSISWSNPTPVEGQVGDSFLVQLFEEETTEPVVAFETVDFDPSKNSLENGYVSQFLTNDWPLLNPGTQYYGVVTYTAETTVEGCNLITSVRETGIATPGCEGSATFNLVQTIGTANGAAVEFTNPTVSGLTGQSFTVKLFDHVTEEQVGEAQTRTYDAEQPLYVVLFNSPDYQLENGTPYFMTIDFFATSDISGCDSTTTWTTDTIVPSGIPYIFDVSANLCNVLFTVNTNSTTSIGTTQRMVVHNEHLEDSVTTQNIFEIVWSRGQMDLPVALNQPQSRQYTVPVTEIWGLGFVVAYNITITRIANPSQIVDNGAIYTPIDGSQTYTVLIEPVSDTDCVVGGYIYASNSTGMAGQYFCSASATIDELIPCGGLP